MPPPDSWCIRVQCIGTVTLLRVLPVREKMKPTEGRKTKGGNHRVLHSSFSHPWNLISTSSFPLFENGEFLQNLLHVWHKLCLSRVYAHWPYKHTTHTHPEGVIAYTLHGQDAQNMCTNNTQCMHHAHNPNTTLYVHTYIPCIYTKHIFYSTNQALQYTTCNFTSLMHSIHTANYKAHTIHFRNKMCTVRYKQYNVSARQLHGYRNKCLHVIARELYTQMQLSHVHTTGRPHNLQRQPWRASQQVQNTTSTSTVPHGGKGSTLNKQAYTTSTTHMHTQYVHHTTRAQVTCVQNILL